VDDAFAEVVVQDCGSGLEVVVGVVRVGGVPGKRAVADAVEDCRGHESAVEEGGSALVWWGGGGSCGGVGVRGWGGHGEVCVVVVVVVLVVGLDGSGGGSGGIAEMRYSQSFCGLFD
jgi:hypothetical protein